MPVCDKPLNLPSSVNNESVLSNQREELCSAEMDIIDKKVVESIIMLVFHVLFSHRYQCAKQSVDFASNAVQDPGANFRRAALFLETAVASSDLN